MTAGLILKTTDYDICKLWIAGIGLLQPHFYGLQRLHNIRFPVYLDLAQVHGRVVILLGLI